MEENKNTPIDSQFHENPSTNEFVTIEICPATENVPTHLLFQFALNEFPRRYIPTLETMMTRLSSTNSEGLLSSIIAHGKVDNNGI